MLDIKQLRKNINDIADNLVKRNFKLDIEKFNDLEQQRKSLQIDTETLQKQRNELSKKIGMLKQSSNDPKELVATVNEINAKLSDNALALEQVQQDLQQFLLSIPNVVAEDVPNGNSDQDNVVISSWGQIPKFSFQALSHEVLGENLNNSMDFKTAAKLSGSRFVVLKDNIAKLHRALAQFMLDLHTIEHGYSEVMVPYLVKSSAMLGTGQFPKFVEDQFNIADKDLWLIPTAEVPVTNFVQEQLLADLDLPLKFVCHSSCFRKEAGSYGKDTKGMFRQHQFEKVELVQIVKPEDSMAALEQLTNHAEMVLQKLQLPYRKVILCGGDIGFSANKTYDLEVWLPSHNSYREVSSCSNFLDFQARRMQAKYKDSATNKSLLVHTLNGSGLAIGRTLIAVLENYQQADGSIKVPQVLLKYMNNIEILTS